MAVTGVSTAGVDPVASLVAALNAATAALTASMATSLQKSSNLSDLASAGTARTNLGLGASALMSTAQIAADSAFTGTYAYQSTSRPAAGRRWCFLGDSITNGSTAGNIVYAYHQQAVIACGTLNARPDFIEAGTSGYTSTQALAFLPTVLANYPDVDGLTVLLGTNDSGTATSAPLATYAANITAIVGMAKSRGIPVVLCTVPPRGVSAATSQNRLLTAQYNTWLRLWGPLHGCEIADVHTALADPTTGDYLSTYDAGDGTHPNALGHAKMAQYVAAAMLRSMGAASRPPSGVFTKSSAFSMVANPLMAGTAGFKPNSWFEQPGGSGTTPTYTCIADDTGGYLPAGQWAVMDFDGTSSGGNRILAISASFTGTSVGDVVGLFGTVLVEDVSGTYESDVVAGTSQVNIQLVNQSAVNIIKWTDRNPGRKLGDVLDNGNTVWQLGPFLSPMTIPAGTTGLILWCSVTVPTGKHLKVRFACMDVRNLTTLGLTAYAGSIGLTSVDGP